MFHYTKGLVILCLALFVACGGEPFTTIQDAYPPTSGSSSLDPTSGSANTTSGTPADSAGSPSYSTGGSTGGSPTSEAGQKNESGRPDAGQPSGGAPDLGNSWRCKSENGLCQCYVQPSGHPPDWFNADSCEQSERCTLRDDTACVCWDTEGSYQNALGITGTHAVERCPE